MADRFTKGKERIAETTITSIEAITLVDQLRSKAIPMIMLGKNLTLFQFGSALILLIFDEVNNSTKVEVYA